MRAGRAWSRDLPPMRLSVPAAGRRTHGGREPQCQESERVLRRASSAPRGARTARAADLGLAPGEYLALQRLDTPEKIQAYLNATPINHEIGGETVLSVREVLRQRRAHCIEGAMLAACALWVNGDPPLVMHLDCHESDYPHVIALFRRHGAWGAISKTNGAPLRYRDPIYRNAARAGALLLPRVLEPARPQDAAQLLGALRHAAHRSGASG